MSKTSQLLFAIATIIFATGYFFRSFQPAQAYPQGPNVSLGSNPIVAFSSTCTSNNTTITTTGNEIKTRRWRSPQHQWNPMRAPRSTYEESGERILQSKARPLAPDRPKRDLRGQNLQKPLFFLPKTQFLEHWNGAGGAGTITGNGTKTRRWRPPQQ